MNRTVKDVKKRWVAVILVMVVVSAVLGYGFKQYLKQNEKLTIEKTDRKEESDSENTNDQLSEKNENATMDLDIYGVWSLDKNVMQTGLIEPEDEYLGYELEYTSDYVRLGDEKYYNPEYCFSTVTVPEYTGGRFDYRGPNFYYFIKEEGIQIEGSDRYDEEKYWGGLPLTSFEVYFSDTSLPENAAIFLATDGVILNKDTIVLGIWMENILVHRIK